MATRKWKAIAAIGAIGRTLAAALLWFFLLRAAGVIFVTAGVYVLFGFGWALMTFGGCLVVASEFIRKGMTAHA